MKKRTFNLLMFGLTIFHLNYSDLQNFCFNRTNNASSVLILMSFFPLRIELDIPLQFIPWGLVFHISLSHSNKIKNKISLDNNRVLITQLLIIVRKDSFLKWLSKDIFESNIIIFHIFISEVNVRTVMLRFFHLNYIYKWLVL